MLCPPRMDVGGMVAPRGAAARGVEVIPMLPPPNLLSPSNLDFRDSPCHSPRESRECLRVNLPTGWGPAEFQAFLEDDFPGQINWLHVATAQNKTHGYFNMTQSSYARDARKKLKNRWFQCGGNRVLYLQPCWANKFKNIHEIIERFQMDPVIYQQNKAPWFSPEVKERLRASAYNLTEQKNKEMLRAQRQRKWEKRAADTPGGFPHGNLHEPGSPPWKQ